MNTNGNGTEHLNQRRTIIDLVGVVNAMAPAVKQSTLELVNVSMNLTALAEAVRRRIAPDILPMDFLAEVAAVREEVLACIQLAAGLQWVWRELYVERLQRERREA